jgi:hypothetical protein
MNVKIIKLRIPLIIHSFIIDNYQCLKCLFPVKTIATPWALQ